jgi:hypothetical protein
MYAVISKWEFDPKNRQAVEERGLQMMQTLKSWEGVELAFNIEGGDSYILSVIGYADEPTYQRLIHDAEGPFERAAQENGIGEVATWVWSERGNSQPG